MTLQMDVQTAGRTGGYNNIPAFSSKSAGIINLDFYANCMLTNE